MSTNAGSNPARILLVEDSRTQALQWISVLESAGWNVIHAESAQRAFELLATHTPQLILIDYYLPGIRGDELCRQIRMRMDTHFVPMVILTGDTAQHVELQGLESGADDFIAKSVEPHVLILRLKGLLAKADNAPRSSAPVTPSFENSRILAVDDSVTYLTFLMTQLQAENYRVEIESSGTAALQRLENEEFDCILVDLVMPDMNGIDVCRRVTELNRRTGKSAMLLMLTAKEDNQSLAQALEAGADDFVGKSSDVIVVKGRIRALLRRKHLESEHHQRLAAELRATELEARQAQMQKKAAEARAALVDDLEKTAAALRQSNEELQQFAYVASHDLQEPLRTVTSYAQLLEQEYVQMLDEEGRKMIAYVTQGAMRMKTLIQDLLAFCRVQSNHLSLQPVSLQDALDDALANLRTAVEEGHAEVTHDDLPLVNGDRGQLTQLLQNLIGNALKYRGKDSPSVHISAQNDAAMWTITVRDNGIGIAPEYAERIFVIFQRLHRASDYPGTGIGLAIAKRIAERHGGRIWVESSVGHGSAFRFTLQNGEQPSTGIQSKSPGQRNRESSPFEFVTPLGG